MQTMLNKGFTIVELLIVIVIIGILATLTIVSYANITDRAQVATLKNDLNQAHKQVVSAEIVSGSYPESNNTEFKPSADNQLIYNPSVDRKSFCLQVIRGTKTFFLTNADPTIREGYCSGSVGTEGPLPTDDSMTASVLAGTGTAGDANGASTIAQFDEPSGIAIDTSGNLLISDAGNNVIRSINSSSSVSTFAGSGTAGYSNNALSTARFNYPQSVAVDSAGAAYIADFSNHTIRKISAGFVSTFAGASAGSSGSTNANGTNARFNGPTGIAVDSNDTIYIADALNHRIRKINLSGDVTTLAGSSSGYIDASGVSARFNTPAAVATDASGNVYVADSGNHRIRKITPAGLVTTLAGSGTAGFADGTGTAAQFNNPAGIAVNNGTVYVADSGNHRIRKITSTGVVSSVAGNGTAGFANGTGTTARFNSPRGLLYVNGILYVADSGNNRIRTLLP